MLKTEPPDWRETRRRSARAAILQAAWALVAEQGLAGLSLRDLARRVGITTPTVYAYFASKNAIYDAMFGQAADRFVEHMTEPLDTDDPVVALRRHARRFVEFSTADLPRYALLFTRTIPGFEPSAVSYAPAVRALAATRDRLEACGRAEPGDLDLWTAMVSGLVAQQNSNDPGGDRWTRLVDDAVSMFLARPHPTRGARS